MEVKQVSTLVGVAIDTLTPVVEQAEVLSRMADNQRTVVSQAMGAAKQAAATLSSSEDTASALPTIDRIAKDLSSVLAVLSSLPLPFPYNLAVTGVTMLVPVIGGIVDAVQAHQATPRPVAA